MGMLKAKLITSVATAAVDKVSKGMEKKIPPHPPCNCPHCPFSTHMIYGQQGAPAQGAPQAQGYQGYPVQGYPATPPVPIAEAKYEYPAIPPPPSTVVPHGSA